MRKLNVCFRAESFVPFALLFKQIARQKYDLDFTPVPKFGSGEEAELSIPTTSGAERSRSRRLLKKGASLSCSAAPCGPPGTGGGQAPALRTTLPHPVQVPP